EWGEAGPKEGRDCRGRKEKRGPFPGGLPLLCRGPGGGRKRRGQKQREQTGCKLRPGGDPRAHPPRREGCLDTPENPAPFCFRLNSPGVCERDRRSQRR